MPKWINYTYFPKFSQKVFALGDPCICENQNKSKTAAKRYSRKTFFLFIAYLEKTKEKGKKIG